MTAQMSQPIRIPADVEREDRVLAGLTARQLAILAVAGLVLYALHGLSSRFVPAAVFVIIAAPAAAFAGLLAVGSRDGVSLDRLLLAALRQRLTPRLQVAAPEGVLPAPDWLLTHATPTEDAGESAGRVAPSALRLPAQGVTETGVINLGPDGIAVVAVASTLNFGLRTPTEQEALVASFGRYLHSLTAPVQILIRTQRLDLSAQIAELRERAGGLPHPALEAAAREHADYLTHLAQQADLLRRQVLLVLREPLLAAATSRAGRYLGRRSRWADDSAAAAQRAAETRLVRRLDEAATLLSAAGIVLTALDAGQATAVLGAACNPDTLILPTAGLAGADEVITTGRSPLDEDMRSDPAGNRPSPDLAGSPETSPSGADAVGSEDGMWWAR